jgi:hypothetical protein
VKRLPALALPAAIWLTTAAGILAGDQMDLWDAVAAREARVEERLAAALRDRFPESPDRRSRTTLTRLLSEAAGAADERRAALLLAADFLAARLAPTTPPTTDEQARQPPGKSPERSETLGGRRITWRWAPLGSTWVYDHALLWTVWQEHPQTSWGEEAFLLLLRRGWDTEVFCRENPDDFRDVIREGERFLRARPASPLRRDVVVTLAWAYETWWSASRAQPGQGYVDDPKSYAAGADQARANAVARYQEALRLGVEPAIAADARRRLAKLQRGADTDQRIFYCVYD